MSNASFTSKVCLFSASAVKLKDLRHFRGDFWQRWSYYRLQLFLLPGNLRFMEIKAIMDTFTIHYCFTLKDNIKKRFSLEIDSRRIELLNNVPENLPSWTVLDFHKCPHCHLSSDKHSHCPVCANMVTIVEQFEAIVSFDAIKIEVVTENKVILQETTAQRAIGALMGLVFATSGCPHTVFFRPMARFHLPPAREETIYRAVSMYLVAQYFRQQNGEQGDWQLDGLKEIYQNLNIINHSIAGRLHSFSKSDSSTNAITLLDIYAKTVPSIIEESLEDIRYLFEPYLSSYFSEEKT